MKRILLVTHHFPPDSAVGGVRPTKFAKYLPQFGWEPVVLTVKERYYDVIDGPQSTNNDLSYSIIKCSFLRNPSYYYRKLKRLFFSEGSIRSVNAHPKPATINNKPTLRDWVNALLAFPDEDTGWIPFAMLKGETTIRRSSIDSILTSGPPHSTHLIGAWLSKRTGLPWVADFRDPLFLAEKNNAVSRKLDYKLETYVMRQAALVLTTTERLKKVLVRRHPSYGHKVHTLPNGYDPDDFAAVRREKAERFTISYLGTLYRNRDPEPVLRAVSGLIKKGLIPRDRIMLRFVGDCENAAGKPMRSLIDSYNLNGSVELLPWLPKQRAFEVMAESHLLLLLAENQELMIPAKVYDYLGIGCDILALTEEGATSDLLRETGNAAVHLSHDEDGVAKSIGSLYEKYLSTHNSPASVREIPDGLAKYNRQRLTGELATLLEQVTHPSPAKPETSVPTVYQRESTVRRVKQIALRVATSQAFRFPLSLVAPNRAVIFMLHRFNLPDLGIPGHDPEEIRGVLEYLRRYKYDLISLNDLIERLRGNGPPLKRTVAFTMDDGHLDQALVAAPLFAAFECPVTTFVVTGFVSRDLWLWWDQVEYVFLSTDRQELNVMLGENNLRYQWIGDVERSRAQADFIERCKEVADTEKRAAIERLAAGAGVELPSRPPPKYASMSWDQLRSCERQGMSVGSHSVTHAVLSRLSDAECAREISRSWERLRSEVRKPIPVFAYPFGFEQDFGRREIAVLRDLGFIGGVSSVAGYASPISPRREPDAIFTLPRFTYPDSLPHVIQNVSGLEHFKRIVRREGSLDVSRGKDTIHR
jgi:peptidoglycan/xylan/chitin deacetylase (PgdA/CDA1 family)/glycosyltransferase involved in cell wall biosynthesis